MNDNQIISNTAVPKYYGAFRQQVIDGVIPVCREVSMQMNRIDALIENPNIYYDPRPVEGFIKYVENEMCLTDGSDATMLDTFKLWAEDLLCWFYYVDTNVYVPNENGEGGHYELKSKLQRLINKQILIVARGTAKSLYCSWLQSWIQNCNRKTTSGITTAPTMKQAEEVINPIKTALLKAKGPLFKFLTYGSLQNTSANKWNKPKLLSTKKGIENFLTNSTIEIRPMTIDKLQGLRCYIATIDEWLSGDVREDVIGAIEQGASKNADYIIVAVSSEGTVRNGSGDDIKLELTKILKGILINPHVSIWWYKLDNIEEINDPYFWMKASPNIGKTVKYEVYQLDVEKAEKAPATRNDILAKRFGIPCEGYTYFFTYEETKVHPKCEFWQLPCSLGADLSRGDDFCSFVFLFPLPDGRFGVKTMNYISDTTYKKLSSAMYIKYQDFIREGSLRVMNGDILDMDEVYEDLNQYICSSQYSVGCFGYDPYNAKGFVKRWSLENGDYGVTKVIQGSRTESVPLGEIKLLTEQRTLLFDQLIMEFALGNAITLEDSNGNRKLLKKHHAAKIDCVAALIDAWVAFKENKEMFG